MGRRDCRYTVDGPAEVEQRIAADQRRVAAAVRAAVPNGTLVALILAGGYGRGEGGYRQLSGHCVPYNDYDYFLVVRGLRRGAMAALRRDLHRLGEELGHEFGLEVDFAVFDAARLGRLPPCLMYSELKWRHRTLLGDARALETLHSPPVADLPLAEFSRMMLNRGALLLMNAEALESGAATSAGGDERFLRYVSKGVLAAGDALLAAVGRYHPSTYERARRVQARCAHDPSLRDFAGLYTLALRVKQGGGEALAVPAGEFPALHRRAVDAWLGALRILEGARLGRAIPDWNDYAAAAVSKGQGGAGWRRAWHLALALRGGAGRALRAGPERLLRHPRERIMAALPLLLGADGRPAGRAAAPLGLRASADRPALIKAFFSDWRRYC